VVYLALAGVVLRGGRSPRLTMRALSPFEEVCRTDPVNEQTVNPLGCPSTFWGGLLTGYLESRPTEENQTRAAIVKNLLHMTKGKTGAKKRTSEKTILSNSRTKRLLVARRSAMEVHIQAVEPSRRKKDQEVRKTSLSEEAEGDGDSQIGKKLDDLIEKVLLRCGRDFQRSINQLAT